MKRFVRFAFLSAVLSASSVQAAIFERDWKTPGDGLLTFDDVNNREWLDLAVTLNIPTPRYENVVAELGPGGLFEGFSAANRNDIVLLAESAGIDIFSLDIDVNGAAANHVIDLLGDLGDPVSGFRIALGNLSNTVVLGPSFPPAHVIADFYYSPSGLNAGLRLRGGGDAFPNPNAPVYLFRQAVPEPDAFLLAIIACVTTSICRYSRRCIAAAANTQLSMGKGCRDVEEKSTP